MRHYSRHRDSGRDRALEIETQFDTTETETNFTSPRPIPKFLYRTLAFSRDLLQQLVVGRPCAALSRLLLPGLSSLDHRGDACKARERARARLFR